MHLVCPTVSYVFTQPLSGGDICSAQSDVSKAGPVLLPLERKKNLIYENVSLLQDKQNKKREIKKIEEGTKRVKKKRKT